MLRSRQDGVRPVASAPHRDLGDSGARRHTHLADKPAHTRSWANAQTLRSPTVKLGPLHGIAGTAGVAVLTKGSIMLYTIAVVLLVLWVLGLVSAYTMGGFIHVLLVIAVVMVLINLIGGRRSL